MKTYGLIGFPLTHSFSKKYFTDKFQREERTDCIYKNFPLEKIDEVEQLFASNPDLAGLNITIPYKEVILPYLDECMEVVKETGACNCIRIINGKKIGYNTDVIGFGTSLDTQLKSSHQKALVLGTGGAAKAVCYALKLRNISYLQISRNPENSNEIAYSEIDKELLQSHTLIINTTPLGMYPNTDACPAIPYEHLTENHYLFDLVYNPALTLFLQKGMAAGAVVKNGTDMLAIQAEASWEIWNS
ncbi:MAG: shikimate dehydrogenase [Bacteroidetes bacterium]|nr:shikimate dehydrogenase [Bacteroidota bacterium]